MGPRRARRRCACGQPRVVVVLTRGALPRPGDVLADDQPRHGRPDQGDRPTRVGGRGRGAGGEAEEASAAAWPQVSGALPRAACPPAPASRVRGLLPAGVDSPTTRRRPRGPGARLGHGRRHAINPRPPPLAAIASPARQAGGAPCHTRVSRARQRQGWPACTPGQRRRHLVDQVAHRAGGTHGARVRRGVPEPQAGGAAVRADPQMPLTSPRCDQAPHAIERTLCARPGGLNPVQTRRRVSRAWPRSTLWGPRRIAPSLGDRVRGPSPEDPSRHATGSASGNASRLEDCSARLQRTTTQSGGMWPFLRFSLIFEFGDVLQAYSWVAITDLRR